MNPDVEQRLDEHNEQIAKIIEGEKQTIGMAGVETGRMTRDAVQTLLLLVGGYGATHWRKCNKLAIELEEKQAEIDRLNAVVTDLKERLGQ